MESTAHKCEVTWKEIIPGSNYKGCPKCNPAMIDTEHILISTTPDGNGAFYHDQMGWVRYIRK